jgi:Tfp pilus assembly protein PilO
LILAVVASVLVSAAFYFLFVNARKAELVEVKASVDSAKSETVELQATLDRLQGLQANAAKFEARLAEIRGLVPQDNQVPNFIFQVQDEANRSGVGFVEITPELPKPPPEGAAVAEVRVAIRAFGGYFAIQDFVRRLYGLDRALRLDNFTMTAEEESGEDAGSLEIGLQATARIFFELPEGAAPATSTTTTAPPADEATTPADQTTSG